MIGALEIDGFTYPLIDYYVGFKKKIDYTGIPAAIGVLQTIKVTYVNTPDIELQQWSIDEEMLKDAVLTLFSDGTEERDQRFEFFDVHCTGYEQCTKNLGKTIEKTTTLHMEAAIVRHHGETLEKHWKVTNLALRDQTPITREDQDTRILNISWQNSDTAEDGIRAIGYAQNASLIAEISNPVGSTATVIIEKEDGSEFESGQTQLTFTETITNGRIELTPMEIKSQWEDFKTADIDKIIAKVYQNDVTRTSRPLTLTPLAKALVHFRPNSAYDGEFGMDYMRDRSLKDDRSYEALLLDPANYTKLQEEAYTILPLDWYDTIREDNPRLAPYTNTWLALAKDQSATLDLVIQCLAPVTKTLQLEYDNTALQLNTDTVTLDHSAISKISNALTVKCLKTFNNEDQSIRVMDGTRQLGQINLVPNDKKRNIEVLMVNVTTDIEDNKRYKTGTPTEADITMLHKVLGQAFCTTTIETMDFDLTKIPEVHQKIMTDYTVQKGRNRALNTNHNTAVGAPILPDFMNYAFNEVTENKHVDVYKIFIFKDDCTTVINDVVIIPDVAGRASSFFKSATVFSTKSSITIAHELLHTIGLEHSFSIDVPYSFVEESTKNVMDYGVIRNHLWYRQWKKLWKQLDKE